MLFDSLMLAAAADELQWAVAGGKVERVTQPGPLEVVLRVYHVGTKHDVLLSCDSEMPRVHLTAVRRENPPQPPPFCALLRKYLDGAWVEGVSLPLGFAERVLHIEFRAVDGARYGLIAEIMGRHSNLIFVNSAGTILGAAKHITRAINRVREVGPGKPYTRPPRQKNRRDPMGAFQPESDPALAGLTFTPDAAAEWLVSTFAGVSPLLAREATLRSKAPLTPETLWYGLNEILNLARLSEYAPRVWSDPQGVTQGAYPLALRNVPEADQYPRESLSLALDNAAASLGRRDAFARAHDALQTALHRTLKTRLREQEMIEDGLRNAERAEEYQQVGDLLKTNQHAIQRGQESATVPDFFAAPQADGGLSTRTITLDPTLGAQDNAERWYKRARKARDSRDTLLARREALADEIALLHLAESDARDAGTEEEVARVRERIAALLARGVPEAPEPGPARKRAEPAFEGHKIRTLRSVDGWEILVGETATANDYLTTRVAASSDIWLHVRAATSAHGIIRAQNRPASVSPAALQQAAELVAARSEVKHSSLIPVDYTLKKYVRKPRKSAPGSVTYTNEKTLYVSGIGK